MALTTTGPWPSVHTLKFTVGQIELAGTVNSKVCVAGLALPEIGSIPAVIRCENPFSPNA